MSSGGIHRISGNERDRSTLVPTTRLGGAFTFAAILLRGERALSVYAAALVLCGGVLFVLLHSLFISD